MAKTDFKTIEEYHNTFPTELQERMQQIYKTIKGVAPDAVEVISYQIPAFKIGKSFLIYYSAYAKHISLSSPWSEAFLHEFGPELKKFKVTKSAIQFLNNDDLPLALIKRMIKFRKAEIEQSKSY